MVMETNRELRPGLYRRRAQSECSYYTDVTLCRFLRGTDGSIITDLEMPRKLARENIQQGMNVGMETLRSWGEMPFERLRNKRDLVERAV